MSASLVAALAVFAALFLAAGGFGFCIWCKKWTEGEFGYQPDPEHDGQGNPEHGFWLQWSRIWEMIGTPICWPINKALGRIKPEAK